MNCLTPEILRAAALRLWDGRNARSDWTLTMESAVLMAGGHDALVEFANDYSVPWSAAARFADYATFQAARFDFLNLLACEMESAKEIA